MNHLLENFDLVATAPDGIAQLRKLILELAVRGKLVPQDPNDEPASILFSRIKADRIQLQKEGKHKSGRELLGISEREKPYSIPIGWEWVRVCDLGKWAVGSGFPTELQGDTSSPILFMKVSDMNTKGNEKYILSTNNTISFQIAEAHRINVHPAGTVVFPKIGGAISTNKRRILTRRTAIDNNCLGIIPTGVFSPDYLYLWLLSIDMTKYQAGTSVPALSQIELEAIPAALPPLAEQSRIVGRVQELMAVLDGLEERTKDAEKVREQTLLATTQSLPQLPTPEALAHGWGGFSENLDRLVRRAEDVKALRSMVLELAVRGKLVPQDPNDEPASVMLMRISKEGAHLVKKENSKIEEALPISGSEEKPYKLPAGWIWVRMSECGEVERGGSPRPIQDYLTNSPDGLSWIKIGDATRGGKYINATKEKIRKEGLSKTRLVYPGDFLLTNSMSFGKPYISNIVGCIHDGWLRIHPGEMLVQDYLYYLLLSKYVNRFFAEAAAGAVVQNLNIEKVKRLYLPLPPLSEQSRIVARVQELMAVFDRLEVSLRMGEEVASRLGEAVVKVG